MKRYRNKAFKFNLDIDKAYKRLYGPMNPVGCAVCGEDEPSVLDIHEMDDSHEFKVLCSSCRGKIARNSCYLFAKYNITQDGITS